MDEKTLHLKRKTIVVIVTNPQENIPNICSRVNPDSSDFFVSAVRIVGGLVFSDRVTQTDNTCSLLRRAWPRGPLRWTAPIGRGSSHDTLRKRRVELSSLKGHVEHTARAQPYISLSSSSSNDKRAASLYFNG